MIKEHIRNIIHNQRLCLNIVLCSRCLVSSSSSCLQQGVNLRVAIEGIVIATASVEPGIQIAVRVWTSTPAKQSCLEVMCLGITEQCSKSLFLNSDCNP